MPKRERDYTVSSGNGKTRAIQTVSQKEILLALHILLNRVVSGAYLGRVDGVGN